MPRVSREEFRAIIAKMKERKAKRKAKHRQLSAGKPVLQSWKKLRDELDTAFSDYIIARDSGPCRIGQAKNCTGKTGLAYHLVPRGSYAIRWDPENVVGACAPCNAGERWHRLKYRLHHVRLFGADLMDRLDAKAATTAKFSRPDLKAMIDYYKARLAAGNLGV